MRNTDKNKLSKLYKKVIDSRNDHHLFCKHMKNFIVEHFEFPDKDDDVFDEFFDLDDDNILHQCDVFHQASDGMVFELCSKNAPLNKVVMHILINGKINLIDYYNYCI